MGGGQLRPKYGIGLGRLENTFRIHFPVPGEEGPSSYGL